MMIVVWHEFMQEIQRQMDTPVAEALRLMPTTVNRRRSKFLSFRGRMPTIANRGFITNLQRGVNLYELGEDGSF